MNEFDHRAMHLKDDKKVVFTAMSKKLFYMRFLISKFVIEQGAVPINPFTSFDYFMIDSVERDEIRSANNVLVGRSDELWVFGPISDGVLAEILLSKKLSITIRYFKIEKDKDISEITKKYVLLEDDVKDKKELL